MRTIAVDGASTAPGKIVCVGKNYAAHVKEMGESKPPSEPVIFMKPNSAIAAPTDKITIPADFGLLHHEVELCFVVSRSCRDVDADFARDSISAWAVGIDFTLRGKQNEAKETAGPWTISKCFDNAAVFGKFAKRQDRFDPLALSIKLAVNGQIRQSARTNQMIFAPVDVLCFASRFMTIDPGDVFMCGTPQGVGEIRDNDVLAAEITSLPPLEFTVIRP
jgi:2-keto-4-pentenoate hydratase/2-oxohepta-3-ene-1,7-dioic acid hydratase in catechol pathway